MYIPSKPSASQYPNLFMMTYQQIYQPIYEEALETMDEEDARSHARDLTMSLWADYLEHYGATQVPARTPYVAPAPIVHKAAVLRVVPDLAEVIKPYAAPKVETECKWEGGCYGD